MSELFRKIDEDFGGSISWNMWEARTRPGCQGPQRNMSSVADFLVNCHELHQESLHCYQVLEEELDDECHCWYFQNGTGLSCRSPDLCAAEVSVFFLSLLLLLVDLFLKFEVWIVLASAYAILASSVSKFGY